MRTRLLVSILVPLVGVCTTTPADAAEVVSLKALAESAARLELRQGHAESDAAFVGSLQQYRNGDAMVSVSGVPIMLRLCRGREHLNIGATIPAVLPTLSEDQRADRIAELYVMTLLRVAKVHDAARGELPLPPAGESLTLKRTVSSDQGDEQYAVTVGHGMGGEVSVKITNRGAAMRAPGVGSDADEGDGDDEGLAGLRELDPVGTWYELVISSGPQESTLPDGMSIKGWRSPNRVQYTSVGEARRASGYCTTHGEASVDRAPR